jgi:1-acyl-sn-glycerol-3-phosphate acyltransferase
MAAHDGLGIDFHHDWARKPWAKAVRSVLLEVITKPLNSLFAPATVTGLHHLEGLDGPCIFVANHASHVDTSTMLNRLPRRFAHHMVIAAAADYFFDKKGKATFWALTLNAIPVERTKIDRRSAVVAQTLIEEGWNLMIFPEGGRSVDGRMQPFKPGAAFLACRTGVPVVPVYLDGTRAILAKSVPGERHHLLRRHHVRVAIGAPLVPGDGATARRFAPLIQEAVIAASDGRAVLADDAEVSESDD